MDQLHLVLMRMRISLTIEVVGKKLLCSNYQIIMNDWSCVGVYIRTPGARYTGGHAVKAIGWGIENGVPYW